MRCKKCHYSLANLKEHRCPECGTTFDPNDSTTFLSESLLQAMVKFKGLFIALAIVAPVVAFVLAWWLIGTYLSLGWRIGIAAVFAVMILATVIQGLSDYLSVGRVPDDQ